MVEQDKRATQPILPAVVSPANVSAGKWAFALVAIGALALALRLYFVTQAVVDHPIRGDAVQYLSAALNLILHHVLSIAHPSDPIVHGDSYRDPGYPIFLALWMTLSSKSAAWYMTTLIAQAFLGCATVLLLMQAAKGWLPDKWLLGAGLLMALWPHSITVCGYLVTETLFGFLCALSLFLLSKAARHQGFSWLIAAGFCFSLAGLTNAVLLPFAPLLAVMMSWLRRLDRKQAWVLALSGLALPFAWQIRNVQLPPSDQSAGGRAIINFVQGSWPEYQTSWATSYRRSDPIVGQTQLDIAREYATLQAHPSQGLAMMYQRMIQAPWHYVGWYFSKPAHLWAWDIQIGAGDIYVYPTLHSPFSYNPVLRMWVAACEIVNPILAVLAAWGCLAALLDRRNAPLLAMATALMALYVTAVYSALQAEPRYAIPFRGMEILLASGGLAQAGCWLRKTLQTRRGTGRVTAMR
ncbi:ArnT family glycosyltransferase [Dyella nitratireducens]|uniref:ArnT family glycosyltransferase n=1 Tax=Dyella nitratireducens TaxID=1849580 RepID=UPI001666BCBB|nr:glycosyltransferase family 39 protein [Dyella nitratireducens]